MVFMRRAVGSMCCGRALHEKGTAARFSATSSFGCKKCLTLLSYKCNIKIVQWEGFDVHLCVSEDGDFFDQKSYMCKKRKDGVYAF